MNGKNSFSFALAFVVAWLAATSLISCAISGPVPAVERNSEDLSYSSSDGGFEGNLTRGHAGSSDALYRECAGLSRSGMRVMAARQAGIDKAMLTSPNDPAEVRDVIDAVYSIPREPTTQERQAAAEQFAMNLMQHCLDST